ncbi:MAG TPA: MFS transporter [Vicinamibacterales bacterium]|jgi:fucose permease
MTLNRRPLFAAACIAMFVFGMVIALLGTLFGLPELRARLGIDLASQGDVFSAMYVGLLISTVLVGPVIDRFGSRFTLLSASMMVTASLVLFSFARSFAAAAVAAALLGFGAAPLNTGGNALVSDIYPEDRGRMLNLLGVCFGVGALFVPLIVALLFGIISLPGIFLLCAAVAALGVVACVVPRFPPPHEAAGFSFAGMVGVAREPGIFLIAALLLFQSGNEAALSGWTSTYVGSLGWSPRVATAVLLGYWVMAILGRMLSSRAQARLGKSRLIVASGLMAIAGLLILLAAAAWLPALTAGAWITAFAYSAVFPTALAIAGDRYHRFAGTVFGFLFSVAMLGSMSYPYLLGHLSQAAGVRFGMLVPLVGTLGMTVCAVLVARDTPRR